MKEEDEIKRLCGSGNPFTVPDGYFESFSKQLMENLPERKQTAHTPAPMRVSLYKRLRPWIGAAAVVAGLAFGTVLLNRTAFADDLSDVALSDPTTLETDEHIESIFSNAMMDDYSIYCYLTDAE